MPHPVPDPVRDGQESVWSFPRPAVFEPTTRHIRIVFGGVVIAETRRALRAIETSHPPSYYIPPDDVLAGALRPAGGSGSVCEWKGAARYFDVAAGGRLAPRAAWSYPAPTPGFAAIRDHVAFYAGPMDECTVDGERVTPQEGAFYGGWITSHVAGPFKGPAGTMGW